MKVAINVIKSALYQYFHGLLIVGCFFGGFMSRVLYQLHFSDVLGPNLISDKLCWGRTVAEWTLLSYYAMPLSVFRNKFSHCGNQAALSRV